MTLRIALILGSGPDVLRAQAWPHSSAVSMVAINNAWQVRSDWDFHIYPEDFPAERMPTDYDAQVQLPITSAQYVPMQNQFGGFVYAGATMAFTAGYWALGALQPDVLAFLGCDMNYQTPQTHFYGAGTADPLRADITLQSLEAKSARLMVLAAQRECLCLNLSELAQSRQVFPRRDFAALRAITTRQHASLLRKMQSQFNTQKIQMAQELESQLGYMVPSGRYWEIADRFDASQLQKIDDLWLGALQCNQVASG
jgi:hypothetical protein